MAPRGIAVGMATNIPPHNLREIVDAAVLLLEKPDSSLKDLMKLVPGPDFPTGGYISGREGIEQAYKTGRGSFIMRAKAAIEQVGKDRENIVVTEIPYQVNKVPPHRAHRRAGADQEDRRHLRRARRIRPRGHAHRRSRSSAAKSRSSS